MRKPVTLANGSAASREKLVALNHKFLVSLGGLGVDRSFLQFTLCVLHSSCLRTMVCTQDFHGTFTTFQHLIHPSSRSVDILFPSVDTGPAFPSPNIRMDFAWSGISSHVQDERPVLGLYRSPGRLEVTGSIEREYIRLSFCILYLFIYRCLHNSRHIYTTVATSPQFLERRRQRIGKRLRAWRRIHDLSRQQLTIPA